MTPHPYEPDGLYCRCGLPELNRAHHLALRIPAPAPFINSNDRRHRHWGSRARLAKAWRDATHVHAKAAKLPRGLEHVTVSAVVYPPKGSRLKDPSNISVKAAIDGLVDYGLVVDDDHTHLRFAGIDRGANASDRAGFLVLIIEPTQREAA